MPPPITKSRGISIGTPRAVDRLPIELYRLILSKIAIDDLQPLLLTSRKFQIEAERWLYAEVRITGYSHRFVTHIATCPRIPPLILSLYVFGIRLKNYEFNQILIGAINLKKLYLYTSSTSLGALTTGVTFKLRHLGSSLRLQLPCIRFIQSQTEITDLTISGRNPNPGPQIFSFDPIIHLPHLKILSIMDDNDNQLKAALFPNRPISHCAFDFYSDGFLPSPLIKSLCISNSFGSNNLSGKFPNLEFLEIAIEQVRSELVHLLIYVNFNQSARSYHKLKPSKTCRNSRRSKFG